MLISKEARELLASEYDLDGKHFLANHVREGKATQFEAALRVITVLLALRKKER